MTTLETNRTGVPTREQMKEAIRRGIEAILFRVEYLACEDMTNHVQHKGGLDVHAPDVVLALEGAASLVRMYDALCAADDDGELQAVQP